MAGMVKKAELKGNELTLVIQLDERGTESSTGKMNLHFTSGGWGQLPVSPNETMKKPLRYNLSIGTSNK